MSLRTPLGRVLGLGTSSGVHHWWAQRLTALALAPLGAWFVVSLLTLPDLGYAAVRGWLAAPRNAVPMLLLVPVVAYHSWLGVAVVLEDYVHGRVTKTVALLVVQFLHLLVATAALLAVLKLALGSGA